jgi:hypothetical protein
MDEFDQLGLEEEEEENAGVERAVLPPGLTSEQDIPAGILQLTIKKLLWLNIKVSVDNIRFKPVFWGEKQPNEPMLLRAANTGTEVRRTVKRKAEYEVR